jgi:preprotein translocase subunit Sec63
MVVVKVQRVAPPPPRRTNKHMPPTPISPQIIVYCVILNFQLSIIHGLKLGTLSCHVFTKPLLGCQMAILVPSLETGAEKKKADGLKKESKGLNALKSTGFLINLGFTIVFTILFLVLLYNVSQDGEVNTFDPFSILEIDPSSDLKAIKKAVP